MGVYAARSRRIGWENHILGLSGLIVVVSLLYVWKTPTPSSDSVPEVVVPLGTSLGLSLYTLRLKHRDPSPVDVKPMATYGWTGALLSGALGVLWVVLYHSVGFPIDVLPDRILTLLSLGVTAGVFVGRSSVTVQTRSAVPERANVLAETTWTNRSGPIPITTAVAEALAEIEDVDPHEVDPLYDHVDPETLAELRTHDGSPWQFTIYTDEYEIRLSSHGTVTVYRAV